MYPDRSRFGPCLALGLVLAASGGVSGAARAQSRPGWVDPPAKAAPVAPAPAGSPAPKAEPPQAQEATRPASDAAGSAKPGPEPTRPAAQASAPKPAQAAKITPPDAEGAALAGPSRRAERARLRRRAAQHVAPRPDTFAAASGRAGGAPDPRFTGWAGRAQGLAGDYLAVFSRSGGAMVAEAPRFYGTRLRFHGRMMTLTALLAEKRRFAQRWPERRYEPRGSQTACNAALESCIVRTIVAFRAGSPSRGALSQGVAELVLEVSFSGGRPVIVSESSRVLRRGATVGALAGPGASV